MNPIMENWFAHVGVTVATRRKGGYPPLPTEIDVFVRYLHVEMWYSFLNGHDHAAIVCGCALLEHAIKDAVEFDGYLKAGKKFDRAAWDKIDGMTFHNVVEYGRKRGVLTKRLAERYLGFKEKYRNKWMHGETPPVVKKTHIPNIIEADYTMGKVEKVRVDLSENPTLQRVGRILADRQTAPVVVAFVDREIRSLMERSEKQNRRWQQRHGDKPPTREQMDRVLDNIRKTFGEEALDNLTLFAGHVPPGSQAGIPGRSSARP